MLKFMLLDLFGFRFVGSKPKFMKIITIIEIMKIMKTFNCHYGPSLLALSFLFDLYYWRSHFVLTFTIFFLFMVGFTRWSRRRDSMGRLESAMRKTKPTQNKPDKTET